MGVSLHLKVRGCHPGGLFVLSSCRGKKGRNCKACRQDFSSVYTASSGDLLLASPRFVDPSFSLYRLSSINHSLCFSFKPWQRAWLNKFNCRAELQCIPKFFHHFFLELCKIRQFATEILTVDLNFDGHFIQMINSVNIYHKLIANLGYFQKHMFYLRREHVDSTDYEHIIASPRYSCDFLSPSAYATVFHLYGNISCTVTEEWHCFFHEWSYHQFTTFTI